MPPTPPAPRSPTPPIPRAVWLLSWVSFFADVSGEMIYPILPLYIVHVLGATRADLGLVEGLAVLVVSALTALAGARSDRTGARVPWIRAGYFLPLLGKGAMALATSWLLVLAGRLLDRFGKGLRGAPRDAMIAGAVADGQRGRAFGVHRALDTTGALLGVLLSAFLLWLLTGGAAAGKQPGQGSPASPGPAWAYRSIFGMAAAMGLVSFVLTAFVREGAPEPASAAGTAHPTGKRSPQLDRTYWRTLGALLLFALANSSDTFLLLRASELGCSPWEVVLLYAVFNVTYAAISYPAGALSDHLGRWRVIVAGWIVYAGVYAAFAFLTPQTVWAVWPLLAIYGGYMALTEGVGKALIAEAAPADRRGEALGIFQAMAGLTGLAASWVAGLLWDHSGPRAAFLLGSGAAGAAIIFRLVWRPGPRQTPAARGGGSS